MNPEVESALQRIEKGTRARKLESETLDFKEDSTTKGRGNDEKTCAVVASSAACLANADGGYVVLGVADDVSGRPAFTGTDLDSRWLRRRVWETTKPSLTVECEEAKRYGVRLLFVRVQGAATVHQGPDGIVRRRIRDKCEPLDPQSIASLVAAKQGHDWSRGISSHGQDDISRTAMDDVRQRLERRESALARLKKPALLRKLGFVLPDGRLTRAGELMLCEHDNPGAGRALYLFRHSSGGEPVAMERLGSPLPVLLDRLTELVRVRTDIIPVNLDDNTQLPISGFPPDAVRETLSNALLHTDWRYGDPITIEHSPDALIVHSPGLLVDGVSESNLLAVGSTPRNRTLFDAAHLMGMSERAGQGIDRMYRELIRAGQEAPSIGNVGISVRVAMVNRKPKTELAAMVRTLPDRLGESLDVLLALLGLTESKTLNSETLARLLQRPHDREEAEETLARLSDDRIGLLEPTLESARSRHRIYRLRAETLRRLGRAVSYHRADPIDLDMKVRRHLADYQEINNRTLQSLFDVDVGRARSMLDDLRRRGIVEKLPGAKRGPAVRYGPGPNL